MRRSSWVAPLAVVLAVLGLSGTAAAGPSAHLDVATDGSIVVSLSLDDPNGSALRAAMDGNFSPIVSLIPGNASSRASVLAQIQTAESSPFLAGLFGNRDGTVEPSEVAMFQTLLRDEAGTLPSGVLTGGGILTLTLNGHPAGSASFGGVTFDGAVGPVDSNAPVTVTSSTTNQFLPEGTTGTVAVSWNFSAGGVGHLRDRMGFESRRERPARLRPGVGRWDGRGDPDGDRDRGVPPGVPARLRPAGSRLGGRARRRRLPPLAAAGPRAAGDRQCASGLTIPTPRGAAARRSCSPSS
jgi:hypothetical protein